MRDPLDDSSPDGGPTMPRWVKASLIIAGILVSLIIVMLLTGHGPGRHLSGANVFSSATTEARSERHAPHDRNR
jgi:hypothetical protein